MFKKSNNNKLKTNIVGIILASFVLIFLSTRDHFRINDEAVNLTMAKNMLSDSEHIIHPSYLPGDNKGTWEKDSLPFILMPPVYPWLVSSVAKVAKTNIILSGSMLQSFFIFIFLLALYSKQRSSFTQALTVLILSSSIFQYLTNLEHEGMLCAFGFLAILAASRDKFAYQFLAGILLGVGFLAKTWLVAPFVVAIGLSHIQKVYNKTITVNTFFYFISLNVLSFIIVSSFHLIYIWMERPEDFKLWIENVYLGVIKSGVNSKFIVTKNQGWANQWWYYLGVFARENFLLSCLFVLCQDSKKTLSKLISQNNFPYFVLLLMFIPLSFVTVKEPTYILPSLLSLLFLINLSDIKINKILFIKVVLISIFLMLINFSNLSNLTKTLTANINISAIVILFLLASIFFKTNNLVSRSIQAVILIFSLFHLPWGNPNKELIDITEMIKADSPQIKNGDIYSRNYSMVSFYTNTRVSKYDWFIRYPERTSKRAKYIIKKNTDSLNRTPLALEVIKNKFSEIKKLNTYTLYKRKTLNNE